MVVQIDAWMFFLLFFIALFGALSSLVQWFEIADMFRKHHKMSERLYRFECELGLHDKEVEE